MGTYDLLGISPPAWLAYIARASSAPLEKVKANVDIKYTLSIIRFKDARLFFKVIAYENTSELRLEEILDIGGKASESKTLVYERPEAPIEPMPRENHNVKFYLHADKVDEFIKRYGRIFRIVES